MKARFFTLLTMSCALVPLVFSSCKRDPYDWGGSEETGTLSFAALGISADTEVEQISRAVTEAPTYYIISIYNSLDVKVKELSYGELKTAGSIKLQIGSYVAKVRSQATVPTAAFEEPVYGADQSFSITQNNTTTLSSVVCKLINIKVTVRYNDKMTSVLTDDCVATVEMSGASGANGDRLEFNKAYRNASGYFQAFETTNTMVVKFEGTINGLGYTTITPVSFSNVKACQWRMVTFVMKENEVGNVVITVDVSDWTEDKELRESIDGSDQILGPDPEDNSSTSTAPKVTYGGNKVPSSAITVTSGMAISFDIAAEKGIKAFSVDMASDNTDFINDVLSLGVSPLDLINPNEAQEQICQMFGFVYGSSLLNATSVVFDLTAATLPLCGFPGTHTFTLTITDNDDQTTVCPIKLKVE